MPKNKSAFWAKIAGVGLLGGLVGGGAVVGTAHVINSGSSITMNRQQGDAKVHQSKVKGESQSTKAYNQVKGAVVSILNQQQTSNQNDQLAQLFGIPTEGNSGELQTASEGSGVIYQKKDGSAYIVTNNHVVKGANQLQVLLANHKKVKATLVGADAATDLAVLKINATHVTSVASFANSNSIQAGQNVLAIGSPMGSEYANTVTKGIISATNRTLKAGTDGTLTSVIQTDAAINSGNSGGPLINEAGQIIGINSMKLSGGQTGATVEGMGFAIPSNEVVKIIDQLVKNGKVERPSLGISMVNLSQIAGPDQKSVLKLPDNVTKGVVVMKVNAGSPAKQGGLKQYDVITKVNSQNITDTASIKSALYKYKVGNTVSITYLRHGKQGTARVHLSQAASQQVQNSGVSNGDE